MAHSESTKIYTKHIQNWGGSRLEPSLSSQAFSDFDDGSAGAAPLFLNRSKLLKPLDNFASTRAQPTLFKKRAALRRNLSDININNGGNLGVNEKKRKNNWDDVDNLNFDRSGLNYDSDDFTENTNSKFEETGVKIHDLHPSGYHPS